MPSGRGRSIATQVTEKPTRGDHRRQAEPLNEMATQRSAVSVKTLRSLAESPPNALYRPATRRPPTAGSRSVQPTPATRVMITGGPLRRSRHDPLRHPHPARGLRQLDGRDRRQVPLHTPAFGERRQGRAARPGRPHRVVRQELGPGRDDMDQEQGAGPRRVPPVPAPQGNGSWTRSPAPEPPAARRGAGRLYSLPAPRRRSCPRGVVRRPRLRAGQSGCCRLGRHTTSALVCWTSW